MGPGRARRSALERDVVVRGAHARRLRLREVCGVGGDVRLGREAVAAALRRGVAAAAEELDGVGDDLDRLALVAVWAIPLAPLQPALDRDRPPLREIGGAVLALRAPHRDIDVVRLVDPLAALVLAPAVHGDPQFAHRGAAAQLAQLRVLREIARDDYDIDVCGCHFCGPFLKLDLIRPESKQRTGGFSPPSAGESATSGVYSSPRSAAPASFAAPA